MIEKTIEGTIEGMIEMTEETIEDGRAGRESGGPETGVTVRVRGEEGHPEGVE